LQEYGGWYVASLLANKLTVGDVQAIELLWEENRKTNVGQAPKD
jgi:hypoxanthine phosphoribosyltransferase